MFVEADADFGIVNESTDADNVYMGVLGVGSDERLANLVVC